MKAWLVRQKDEYCAAVVFAETRGKARALAMHTDACEDSDFCDIEVHRMSHMDKYYQKGKREMDWDKADDRIALVKDAGFYCDTDYIDREDCDYCPARNHCDVFQGRSQTGGDEDG